MPTGATHSLYLESDLNRVFTGALATLAATELRIVADRLLPGAIGDIERVAEGRAQILRFASTAADDRLASVVGRLSASAALFRHCAGAAEAPGLLRPIPLHEDLVHGTELVTTQRYRGKTNERLTRAMLNVALATAGIDLAEPTGTVLDPLCGRGTTLNWALAYGLDGVGIDDDRSSLDQHATFLETWAKRHRLPHKAQRHRDRNTEHRVLTMHLAPDRATFKAGAGQRIQTFRADGADGGLPIRRASIDVVVTDLPYGVQHRAAEIDRAGSQGRTERFDPAALLARALPTWRRWLRPGGALCLAWNLKQAGRDPVSRTLVEAGFAPVVAPGGYSMRHVVDTTIDRDVIVAARVGAGRSGGSG
jgi:SAM-dependent methyltransferase